MQYLMDWPVEYTVFQKRFQSGMCNFLFSVLQSLKVYYFISDEKSSGKTGSNWITSLTELTSTQQSS